MHSISQSFSTHRRRCLHLYLLRGTLYDGAAFTLVRDRGLDHAVERERNLRPVINIKNIIKSEPSKSLPLSLIAESRHSLQIPTRPIDFIRKYPSVFEEFLPGGIGIHPHIKLTPQVLSLDAEEQLVYQSVNYKENVALRLLKLLMIGRINKIPLKVIDLLKWDLGLPQDYVKTVVPEFPDYFQVVKGNYSGDEAFLELVCWSDDHALSEIEKKAKLGCGNGGGVEFSLTYSNGFEVDKKYKKWVNDWQKLPYISPYQNAMHLPSKSDLSDKWAVGVLHDILNLFVGKKAERDSVLSLGESLGIRSRFKMALLQHPGIFYVSSKIGTHTVVLKEAYKRGALVESNPIMEMRFKYVHLMNQVKEDDEGKTIQPKGVNDLEERNESSEKQDERMYGGSDDQSDDSYGDEDEESEDVIEKKRGNSKMRFGEHNPRQNALRMSNPQNYKDNVIRSPRRPSRKMETQNNQNVRQGSKKLLDVTRNKGRSNS